LVIKLNSRLKANNYSDDMDTHK